jgi:uncharacterized membrane protein
MDKARLEAFSDGVIAIIITIMVLELKVPDGKDWAALQPLIPHLLSYVLSFIYVGIYWNNHHHLLHAAKSVNGKVLWANLHMLFWLSLIPFITDWMGENNFAPLPVALYGAVLLLTGCAYVLLSRALIECDGKDSALGRAVGNDRKGIASQLLYLAAIPLAFVNESIALTLYVLVALLWFLPDRRIERMLAK